MKFPWLTKEVTESATSLIEAGQREPKKVALAVAKAVYAVHPVTGEPYIWPAPESDRGAQLIFDRLTLRVATLIAAHQEGQADEILADVASSEDATPRIAGARGVAAGRPVGSRLPAMPPGLTLRGYGFRPVGPAVAVSKARLHPIDVMHGSFRTVASDDQLSGDEHSIAFKAIFGAAMEHAREIGTGDDVAKRFAVELASTEKLQASFVSLVATSPSNNLGVGWNDEHELPSTELSAAEHGTRIWLPRLNLERLWDKSQVTTFGVTWSDESNAISAPPDASIPEIN